LISPGFERTVRARGAEASARSALG
jgi:hypothetical protein